MNGKYFLYDPEDGFQAFATAAERDEAAAKALPLYIVDGEWDDEVFGVVAGEITHVATKTDVIRRPDALNENGEDEAGEYWAPDVTEKFNVTLQPHPTPAPSGDQERVIMKCASENCPDDSGEYVFCEHHRKVIAAGGRITADPLRPLAHLRAVAEEQGDDERMHCSLCGTPIYEDIISGNPDAPLIPLDENGECPECAAIPAPSGEHNEHKRA